ncbi:MAG: hypothetical protein FWC96_07260 [Oscillospiraceae bacterium]|nr:hypothetical protein [Oscillospiraceae bacterium]
MNGYEIVRAIQFDNDRGFAIGLNPHAVNQFVTWQFTTENGARDFYWGNYCDELSDAAQNYTARIISYMDDYDVKEVRREAVVVSNRTAGITPDMNEVKQTLNTPEKKPSTLKQIRDARSAPKPPRKEKKPSRSHGDIDI